MLPDEVISVSEFIDLFNQTLEYAYPSVVIEGELANLRVSKNKWVYFDLKDENSSLKFFGTVYMLHTPLENGMLVKVGCYPKLHSNYGLSMQVRFIEPTGEGSIKRAALLLEQKLRKEGLFAEEKKRLIPYPPSRIGLITSAQSAAYADFIKIINSRWQGIDIDLIDVQVQGEAAINDIVGAIDYFNYKSDTYDVLIIIRGGGSPEDLAVFSTENVTRAVSNSQIPTLVAIGHEIDVSLAELAADRRASTPSNAAELLVPDNKIYFSQLLKVKKQLKSLAASNVEENKKRIDGYKDNLLKYSLTSFEYYYKNLQNFRFLLNAYDPKDVLKRGYSIVRSQSKLILNTKQFAVGDNLDIQFSKGKAIANVREKE